MNMKVAIIVTMVVSFSVLFGVYLMLVKKNEWSKEDKSFIIAGCVAAFILTIVIAATPLWYPDSVETKADGMAIDLDNCRYVGAEVYTTDDDHTVVIDITNGDGALYAYDGQVDATAQYMLTLDAKTGDVLVVWQNVN